MSEKNLGTWNMQVNAEVVYLNLKFIPEGHIDRSTPAPGFHKKSPSEKSRDYQKLSSYKGKSSNNEVNHTCGLNDIDGSLFAADLNRISMIDNKLDHIQQCMSSEKPVIHEVDPETENGTCDTVGQCHDHDVESTRSDSDCVQLDVINETFNKVVHDSKSK